MKIGVVGTIWLNTPPKGYGGTEEVVYNLVNGLVEEGHEVTLFAPATAKTKAKLIPTVPKPLRDAKIDWTDSVSTLMHMTTAFDHAREFDVLHVQLNRAQDYISLPLATHCQTPVLFTLHFKLPLRDKKRLTRKLVLEKYRSLPFVSISNSQRQGMDLNYIATVYNGLQLKQYPFFAHAGKYLVWIGRVHPDKGTKDAILAAKRAKQKLVVVGALDRGEPAIRDYYDNEIKPLLDGKEIVWAGEVSAGEKADILGKAAAFLNPIHWEEPFGLVMTESQAVGTPVISYRRGSAPELIVEGKTGFLVDSLEEMVEAISQVDKLTRTACRQNVIDHFTVPCMVDGYLDAYRTAINDWDAIRATFQYN